jgi:ABC-2 type transport system permease protein
MLGAVILAKEERDKTSEFLYVKPLARNQVLTAKLLAALTLVATLCLLTWAYSVGMVRAFGENADAEIARLMVGLFLVQMVFLAAGFTAAAVTRHPKAATGIAAGFMLSAYILSVAIEINGNIDWAKVFTPFSYFDAKRVIGGGEGLNLGYILLCVALGACLTTWAYLRFPKRDLRV